MCGPYTRTRLTGGHARCRNGRAGTALSRWRRMAAQPIAKRERSPRTRPTASTPAALLLQRQSGCGRLLSTIWCSGWRQGSLVAGPCSCWPLPDRPRATGAATATAGQMQVSVEAALAALAPDRWELVVADNRPRPTAGTGVDADPSTTPLLTTEKLSSDRAAPARRGRFPCGPVAAPASPLHAWSSSARPSARRPGPVLHPLPRWHHVVAADSLGMRVELVQLPAPMRRRSRPATPQRRLPRLAGRSQRSVWCSW